jgi:hypothetical protein
MRSRCIPDVTLKVPTRFFPLERTMLIAAKPVQESALPLKKVSNGLTARCLTLHASHTSISHRYGLRAVDQPHRVVMDSLLWKHPFLG